MVESGPGLLRDLYPGASSSVYLDVAAVGLISSKVQAAVRTVATQHEQQGMSAFEGWAETVSRTRASIGDLVGGDANRVAFTQNTSSGLAMVANGISWRAGDNVVVPAQEFPSNFYPWVHLRRHGVEVREVPMQHGRAPLDWLESLIDERTRVVSISAVQYSSGHRYDLQHLGERLQAFGALFVVDATQAAGAMVINADAWKIDVLAVSAHKWMLGPLGTAFVHLSHRAMAELEPSVMGWMSVESPFDMDHEPHVAADGRRFESGTMNIAGIAGLEVAIGHVLELGRERVERHILDRSGELTAMLRRNGWTVLRDEERRATSGIVMTRPGADASKMHAHLQSAGVRCSLRQGAIRFSPHYYTSSEDIEALSRIVRA